MSDLTWKPGPPPLDRLNEGWLRRCYHSCAMLVPYRVRYSKDTLTLALFYEHREAWVREGSAFYDLIIDYCETPAAPEWEVKITSVRMDKRFLDAGHRLMQKIAAESSVPIPSPPNGENNAE